MIKLEHQKLQLKNNIKTQSLTTRKKYMITRKEIYKTLINNKREDQEIRWASRTPGKNKHSEIASWITYMRYYLNEAEKEVTLGKDIMALQRIIDVVALGVACLEYKYPDKQK